MVPRETPPSAGQPAPGADQPLHPQQPTWPHTALLDRLALPIALVVLLVLTVPRLPPGVCFADAGDLQATAATLGIAHPPGYAGYVSLGHVLGWVPGVSPAYAVSLACLGAGLTALALCALLQMRLGVNAWIAAALALTLAHHPRVWVNLVAPEIYAPSLAFEAGAAYLLLRHARREAKQARRDLLIAALLLGIALANRPPLALALPGFLLALWLTRRRSSPAGRLRRHALLAAAGLLAPCAYSFAYLWVRDTPSTPCNYVEGYATESGELPPTDAGVRAKLQRIVWLTTGQQFRSLLRSARPDILGRLRWLTQEVGLEHDLVFIAAATALAWGLVLTTRQSPGATALLLGIGLATTVFVCLYRVYDTAADILPLLFVLIVLVGLATSPLFPTRIGWLRRATAIGAFGAACVWVVIDLPRQPDVASEVDATAFVKAADLPTLPANAVIFSAWRKSRPLLYAQYVEAARSDTRVVTTSPSNWVPFARRCAQPTDLCPGSIYLTDRIAVPDDVKLTPFRNLWQLDFTGSQTATGN